jgi:hypothetical protein
VAEGVPAQATFTLEVNEWNGVSEPRLVLRKAMPAAVAAEATPVAPAEPVADAAPAPELPAAAPTGLAAPPAAPESEPEELVLFALP